MKRAEHPCYQCKEIPPWKLHIKGRAVRCSSFQLGEGEERWNGGRRQEIKGTNQKRCGEEVGRMREGGIKPTPNPLSHLGQRKPEGPAGTRSYGPGSPACVWIPVGDYLLPFWSAGWGGTCGYLEGFLIWKFTLSSSTFRLIEAAESLSTVDWKLLTEVRLLGLAESFSVGEGKEI